MAQIIIDTGAAANDGTGDPLRTAFTDTNLNFTAVFTAGPVDSNVRIANNTILTLNTNGNLVLAPNGTGRVVANVDIVPNSANIRSLGSSLQRWSTIYTQYLDVTASASFAGNLAVGGNLTVAGNIIQIGNIVTDSLTIQLANTSSTANSANGAGITVGANDNIATLLYNSTGNVWTTNIGISAVGNITAPYFIGNGSQLTGLAIPYGNSNVATFLANYGSNTIVTSGNISAGNVLTSDGVIASGVIQSGTGLSTGGYLSVNGSTDLHDTTVTGNLSADTLNTPELTVNVIRSDDSTIVVIQDGVEVDGDAVVNGNISGEFILGNISQATGFPATYGNANVANYLPTFSGNISAGNVSVTGNITGAYVKGNGSELTNLPAPTVTQDITSNGAMSIMTYDGVIKYVSYATVEPSSGNIAAGNISTTGNVAGNYFIGNGSQLTGISTANTGNVTFNDVNIIGTGNLNLQPNGENSEYLNIYLTGAADIHVAYGGGSGNVILGTDEEANVAVLQGGNVAIQAGNVAGTKTWTFDTAGNLTLPRGGIVYETNIPDGVLDGNTIALKPSSGTNADQQLLIYPTTTDANHLHLTSGNLYNTELFLGSDDLYVKLANTGAVVINSNDGVGNTAQWTFDNFGTMTLPGNMIISGNTSVFGTDAALIQTTDNRPLLALSSGANGAVSSIWVEDVANVGTSNIAAVYANPTVGSGIVRIAVGQNGGGGPNLWDFDTTGNLTVPGNIIVATGNVTGGNVLTTGIVSATGNVSGNYFIGNGSQLTGIAASYGNANVATFLAAYGSNTISTTGNITAGNLIGNISITGNVTGTSANVTLVAGAYSTVFDNTGNLTLPGNTFSVNYANNTPVNAVTRFESAWTVPVGNSTQSFTVAASETYQMWVDCNIPNGILAWNATATVTNTNVPVVGAQYAWVYDGGGTPIDFTSIPNQFVGTANTILRSSVAPSATTNRFDFGLNNTSGGNVTVRYGWVAIS